MRSLVFGIALLPLLSAAWLVEPPTAAAPDTIQDCTFWAVVEPEENTCQAFVNAFQFSMRLFKLYNPSTVNNCNLVVGNSYCIEQSLETPVDLPSNAELLGYCQSKGSSYTQYCERCMSRCTSNPLWYDKCFDDLFFDLRYIHNGCEMNGNKECEKYAVDYMCKQQ